MANINTLSSFLQSCETNKIFTHKCLKTNKTYNILDLQQFKELYFKEIILKSDLYIQEIVDDNDIVHLMFTFQFRNSLNIHTFVNKLNQELQKLGYTRDELCMVHHFNLRLSPNIQKIVLLYNNVSILKKDLNSLYLKIRKLFFFKKYHNQVILLPLMKLYTLPESKDRHDHKLEFIHTLNFEGKFSSKVLNSSICNYIIIKKNIKSVLHKSNLENIIIDNEHLNTILSFIPIQHDYDKYIEIVTHVLSQMNAYSNWKTWISSFNLKRNINAIWRNSQQKCNDTGFTISILYHLAIKFKKMALYSYFYNQIDKYIQDECDKKSSSHILLLFVNVFYLSHIRCYNDELYIWDIDTWIKSDEAKLNELFLSVDMLTYVDTLKANIKKRLLRLHKNRKKLNNSEKYQYGLFMNHTQNLKEITSESSLFNLVKKLINTHVKYVHFNKNQNILLCQNGIYNLEKEILCTPELYHYVHFLENETSSDKMTFHNFLSLEDAEKIKTQLHVLFDHPKNILKFFNLIRIILTNKIMQKNIFCISNKDLFELFKEICKYKNNSNIKIFYWSVLNMELNNDKSRLKNLKESHIFILDRYEKLTSHHKFYNLFLECKFKNFYIFKNNSISTYRTHTFDILKTKKINEYKQRHFKLFIKNKLLMNILLSIIFKKDKDTLSFLINK